MFASWCAAAFTPYASRVETAPVRTLAEHSAGATRRFIAAASGRFYNISAPGPAGGQSPPVSAAETASPSIENSVASSVTRTATLRMASRRTFFAPARADEETKLAPLGAGASDFLPKPFSTTELHVRIKNLAYRVRDIVAGTEIVMAPTDPDLRDYNVAFEKIGALLDFRPARPIEEGITEILNALRTGSVDPDDRRWYTLRQYQFLAEVERTWNNVAMDGRVLS